MIFATSGKNPAKTPTNTLFLKFLTFLLDQKSYKKVKIKQC
jgi:hypothetical protein